MPKFSDRTNETRQMNNNLIATIVKYKNSMNIDVQFVESKIIIYNCRYAAFKNGQIRLPMLFEYKDNYIVARNINLNPIVEFIIDKEDINIVKDRIWHFGTRGYIFTTFKNKSYALHRLIMNAKSGEQIDHADGNILNNKHCNLRFCTTSENGRNKNKSSQNTSGYKGVWCYKKSKRWVSQIYINNKRIILGYFDNKLDAARAYNEAALNYHGEFARLNEV